MQYVGRLRGWRSQGIKGSEEDIIGLQTRVYNTVRCSCSKDGSLKFYLETSYDEPKD
jgi:hypothetical protein